MQSAVMLSRDRMRRSLHGALLFWRIHSLCIPLSNPAVMSNFWSIQTRKTTARCRRACDSSRRTIQVAGLEVRDQAHRQACLVRPYSQTVQPLQFSRVFGEVFGEGRSTNEIESWSSMLSD
jgi:hypothetical protein